MSLSWRVGALYASGFKCGCCFRTVNVHPSPISGASPTWYAADRSVLADVVRLTTPKARLE